MQKINKILILLILLILSSCKSGVNIEIINSSKLDIQKIVVKTGFSTHDLAQLKINETKHLFIDFKGKSKNDGIMGLYIYKKNKPTSIDYKFGYYSNGIPPEDIKIIIKDHT
ncbi:MAG: hypothetical protein ACPGUU_08185, partial [Flavobacteriaceae bacterium]